MSSPEQIQRDIENTRESLRTDVDRFTEKVSPGRVVGRRVERVKNSAASARERVMGALPDTTQIKDTASSLGDTAASAPQAVRKQTQGSPLAAGVVAFGIGMILSSLVPATESEQQVVELAEARAREPLQQKASEIAEELKEPAMHAVEQVKETAGQAASATADDARSAAEEVRQPFQS
ncbi:MAG: hypothetical protein QOH89_2587 [Pseudonocardiales bacterium]|nr:hypothetical protein [Pseudonocardiales bacterium]